jgi:hypothetical protein
MYNCYAIDGLKSAIMAASLRCPGFSTLLLNLGLPPIPGPKAFDAQVSARATPALRLPPAFFLNWGTCRHEKTQPA